MRSLNSYMLTLFHSNPSLSADGTWTTTYWPLHTPHKREILELNANFSRIVHGHRVKKCAFWKKFLPRLTSLGKSDGTHLSISLDHLLTNLGF